MKAKEDELAAIAELPLEQMRFIRQWRQGEPLSLEAPVSQGDPEHSRLGDFIEDKHLREPEEMRALGALKKEIKDVLSTLMPREACVIRARFGIEEPAQTLEEIGQRFDLSRERIRQIEKVALHKLQHPVRKKQLQSFY